LRNWAWSISGHCRRRRYMGYIHQTAGEERFLLSSQLLGASTHALEPVVARVRPWFGWRPIAKMRSMDGSFGLSLSDVPSSGCMDDVIAGGIPECQSEATRYRCERPSNVCRRAVERVLKARRAGIEGKARRCETRCQKSRNRVSCRNRIAPRPPFRCCEIRPRTIMAAIAPFLRRRPLTHSPHR